MAQVSNVGSVVKYGIAYCLTFANGKKYVGITTQRLPERMQKHAHNARNSKRAYPLYAAWRKHGEPTVSILGKFPIDELGNAEIRFIQEIGTLAPQGYNVLHGGEISRLGIPHSAETKAKMSMACKGRVITQETRDKLAIVWRGRKHKEETKAKIGAAHKGRTLPPDQVERIRASKLGRPLAPEHRARLTELAHGRRGIPRSPDVRAKISAGNKGKTMSLEARARMSASAKRRQDRSHSEATRRKMSASAKDFCVMKLVRSLLHQARQNRQRLAE